MAKPQTFYTPKPGHDWNPLKKHRNLTCPCGSGKKTKRCHGVAEAVPEKVAKELRVYLKRRGLE